MDKQSLKDFKKAVEKGITPAVEDLKNLDEKNRVHVQKLVYTNLVNRFDTMIDIAILSNCREEYLVDQSVKNLNSPITESDLLRLLLHSENLQDALDTKLKNGLRNSVLRNRHSKKLSTLFKVFQPEVNCWDVPRVNISTGKIAAQIKPQRKKQPYSLCGYADWLYSRRNSIVHGAGTTYFLENDRNQLEKLFNCPPAKSFKIRLSSVTNTIEFYNGIVDILDA